MRVVAVFVFMIIIAAVSASAVPRQMSVQGKLTDTAGVAVPNGLYTVTFSLYDLATGGITYYQESKSVTTSNGLFSAIIGESLPLNDNVLKYMRYLGIKVGTSAEMVPRTQLLSVPFAFHAGTIDSALGGTIYGNLVVTGRATIGINNVNSALGAFVAGDSNTVSGMHGVVSGGSNNSVLADFASVNGGRLNEASGYAAGVGCGTVNTASGDYATVASGQSNQAFGSASVVSGGVGNTASGIASMVLGGYSCIAEGNYSLAAGTYSRAYHPGVFIWGDSVQSDFSSTAANQFLIKAHGGVGIGTNAPEKQLQVQADSGGGLVYALKLSNEYPATNGTSTGILFQVDDGAVRGKGGLVYERTNTWNRGDFHFLQNGAATNVNADMTNKVMTIANSGNVGIGNAIPGNILTVKQSSATDPIADAWTVYSSRRWKEHIQTIENPMEIVKKLRGVRYEWKVDGKKDIGLIAEEVGQVIPEIVQYEENGVDARSVDYARLVSVLIEAVKTLDARVKQLEVQVSAPTVSTEKLSQK